MMMIDGQRIGTGITQNTLLLINITVQTRTTSRLIANYIHKITITQIAALLFMKWDLLKLN